MKTRAFTTIIAAAVMALWICANVQAEPPDVQFLWPTPDNGATVIEPTVQIKATIAEIDHPEILPDLREATFSWEEVGYTLYDSSLVLMFNFNNISTLGEDYTNPSVLGVKDLSRYGNHGHVGILSSGTGVPGWAESDGFGGCFSFNANASESILVPHDTEGSLDPGAGDFAIAFWMFAQDNVDTDIMRKGSTETTVGYDMWYKLEHSANSDNKISLNFNTNGTDATIYSTDSYADYSWHFVLAQRRGDQAELWIDGEPDGTAPVTGDIYNQADLSFGSKDTQDDDFFSGMLDEIRIYKRSFSSNEIQLLYDSMLGIYPLEPTTWTLDVTRSGLETGDYTYAVSATTNDPPETWSNQRTVQIRLPAPPDVTLVSPANGSVLNDPIVTFTVSAIDPIGLASATLYIGTPGQVATFSGSADTDDAQISADSPNSNYGGATSINVDGLSPHAHAVIKFPNLIGSGPGQVPAGTTIASATLQVNCTNYGAMMQVYRVTSDWSEDTVTWNNPWTNPGGDYDPAIVVNGDCTATGLRTIDVTEFVQAWSDGTPNYGILLTDSGATDGLDFDSSEGATPPLLTVIYAGDWQEKGTQTMSGDTSDTVTFANVELEDMTDYVWNCLVTNTAVPPMSSWAAQNFDLGIDGQTPDEPMLVSPADGATGVPTPTTLEVTVSDPQTEDPLDVTFYGRKKVSGADDFTIVALPDTQKYVLNSAYPEIFTSQTQWIVNNASSSSIVFVTHEGDIVDTYNSTTEWTLANNSMSLLDGVVPYGVLPGNHDLPTTYYNQYFPYTRYESETWYGGHYPTTGNDNNYQLFSASGVDFVILHLQYNPGNSISDPVIAWADDVLKTYSDRFAIITTHAYLDTSANRLGEGAGIWTVLVQNNDNVYLVLCGHMHGEARRTDIVNGREVHQVLADYQSRANGGDGWLRKMRFVPAENKIYVDTYSPWRDESENDADSQFELDVPLNWFTEIGTNLDVANGSNTSVSWTDLTEQSEYEWYVTVTDSTERTSVGPVWSFTAGILAGPPDANDDSYTANEDEPLVVSVDQGVLENDSDPENDSLTAVLDTDVSHGTLTLNDDGSLTYDPQPDFIGDDSFTYKAFDGVNYSAAATVTITVVNANDDPPVAVNDTPETNEDVGLDIDVLANDSDPDGDDLSILSVTAPNQGGTAVNNGAYITYTPVGDFYGAETFSYTLTDSTAGDERSATVTVTVNPVNDDPVAADDTAATDEDTPVTIDVLGNDTDVDGDPLSVISVTQPANGSVVNNGSDVSYTPNADFFGSDSFTYTAGDGNGGSALATVNVTVNPINDPPAAPQNLSASPGDSLVNLDWDDNIEPEGDLQGYNVYRSQTPGSYGAALAFVTTSDYSDNAVTNDTTYYYVVKAADSGALESGASNEVSATTVGVDYDAYVSQEPIVTYGVLGGNGIAGTTTAGDGLVQTITESPNGQAGASSLQVEYILHTAANRVDITALTLYLGVSWSGLDAADPVISQIRIWNGSGWTIITDYLGGSYTPADPQNYVDASGNIRLRFTDTAPIRKENKDTLTVDLLYAHVAAGPVDNPPGVSISSPTDGATFTSGALITFTGAALDIEDGDISAAMTWQSSIDGGPIGTGSSFTTTLSDGVHLITASATDSGANTGIASVTIRVGDPPPAAPTGLAATTGDGQVSLDWGDNGEADLAGYNVYQATVSGGPYTKLNGTLLATSDYLDLAVTNGVTYYYVVTAVDAATPTPNESGYSSEASATPSSQQAIYVASINMSLQPAGKNTKALAGITISQAQAGAIVYGNWYFNGGIVQTGATGTTDAGGYTGITSAPVKTSSSDVFRFEVTDVVLAGYVYDPDQSVTDGEITVP
ncbi:MAG: tandem-95 repeat protein [Sedimentisphaerales bacterium]|nr:tandem-95 repeat protein [Sedimentisphaerales bacterium]